MDYVGSLTRTLRIYNKQPWEDALELVDKTGAAVPITGSVVIGLRRLHGGDGTPDFVSEASEISVTDNIASWSVPQARMEGLAEDLYELEIKVDGFVRVTGQVEVKNGVLP